MLLLPLRRATDAYDARGPLFDTLCRSLSFFIYFMPHYADIVAFIDY